MYIVDEEQVENIYNAVKDLTMYSFTGTTIIDPAIDIGDKIIIGDKTIIYQGEMNFQRRFIADIKSTIQIKAQEETTARKQSQIVINRKVQSNIDQINGTITQLIEETSENKEQLSKHEQTIDSISNTVSTMETNIKENYSTTEETETIINQTAEDITSTVENTYTTKAETSDAINNIEIGGKNLILKSDFSDVSGTTTLTVEDGVVTMIGTTNVSNYFSRSLSDYGMNNIRNKTITLSCDIKVTSEITFGTTNPWIGVEMAVVRNTTTGGSNQWIDILGSKEIGTSVSEWTKYSVTREITDYDLSNCKIMIYVRDATGTVQYKNLKLEIGNKATDWTPAPEDLTNYTDEQITATKSEIKQTTDSISLEVSKKANDEDLTGAKILVRINEDTSEAQINADKISLEGYTTINGGFSVDENGNASIANDTVIINEKGVNLADGAEIIGGSGVLTNFQYIFHSNHPSIEIGDFGHLGFFCIMGANNYKSSLIADVYIPNDFTITEAKVILYHAPIYYADIDAYGYARSLKLYKVSDMGSYYLYVDSIEGTDVFGITETLGYSEISKGLGVSSYTPSVPNSSNHELEMQTGIDIKSYLSTGNNRLKIESSNNIPTTTTSETCGKQTGFCKAILNVIGYTKN